MGFYFVSSTAGACATGHLHATRGSKGLFTIDGLHNPCSACEAFATGIILNPHSQKAEKGKQTTHMSKTRPLSSQQSRKKRMICEAFSRRRSREAEDIRKSAVAACAPHNWSPIFSHRRNLHESGAGSRMPSSASKKLRKQIAKRCAARILPLSRMRPPPAASRAQESGCVPCA